MTAPVKAATPFRESVYFPADVPMAFGYRLELERGRVLQLDLELVSEGSARLFVELFEWRDDVAPRRVASLSPDERSLRFEVEDAGVYILRVRPAPRPTAPAIDTVPSGTALDVLGVSDAFSMVRTGDARTGWVDTAVLR